MPPQKVQLKKNWRTNECFTYSAKCCSVMTCWRQTSADWAQIKKKHNKTPSKGTQIPHLLWPAINLPALEAIFSSPSTLCVIEKLREGTTGSMSDPRGGGPLRCVVTCGQTSETSSQRFWLQRRPAESCRPHTTTSSPPAWPLTLATFPSATSPRGDQHRLRFVNYRYTSNTSWGEKKLTK